MVPPVADCLAVVRVRLPDRPGALGLVASRVGAVKGDIVGVEVIDRSAGVAVDELAVVLPDEALIPTLAREIGEVDGSTVESVTVIDAFPEPRIDALRTALALGLAARNGTLAEAIAREFCTEMRAEWCALTADGSVLAVTPGGPATADEIARRAVHSEPIGISGSALAIGRNEPLRPGELQLLTTLRQLAEMLAETGP